MRRGQWWEHGYAGKYRIRVVASYLKDVTGLALDIGSGSFHQEYGSDRLVSLDISPVYRPTVLGDAVRLPFKDTTFDLVIATEVIEHVLYPGRMLDEVRRVLRPGGRLLISTPNVASLEHRLALLLFGYFVPDRTTHEGTDPGHIHFLEPHFLRNMLEERGFRIISDQSEFLGLGRWIVPRAPSLIPKSLRSLIFLVAERAGLYDNQLP